jgi:cytochrome c-type biogenesis protein CcsB
LSLETFLFGAGKYGLLLSVAVSAAAVIIKKMHAGKKDPSPGFAAAEKAALLMSLLAFLLITAFIAARAIRTGHGPFTSMYEFSVAFAWGILAISMFFAYKYKSSLIDLLGMAAGACLVVYAGTLSPVAQPLVPALQNSLLLSAHVFSAVVAYGAFTVGLIASILFLIQRDDRFAALPDSKTLEKISYHSVMIGFPFMTLVIVLGAVWADIAWGRFWGWDPKETASLVTWLLYAAYLHTRIVGKWQGRKSAILLIAGFAAVAFTFLGWIIAAGYLWLVMNFFVKLINRRFISAIPPEEPIRKRYAGFMQAVIKSHIFVPLFLLTIILLHFLMELIHVGFFITGVITICLMLVQISVGIYGAYVKKRKKGPWLYAHRTMAAALSASILAHVTSVIVLNP